MFVKKFVEKASFKKPVGISDGLKPDFINPRLVFHYGIPSRSILLVFESIHKILAVSTKDGRIKLFGKDGAQALLESPDEIPSKFLQFMENQGILININAINQIEVWDVDSKRLAHVHEFDKEITSFMVLHHTPYIFVGDSCGNVSVLKVDREDFIVERKQYHVPFSASHRYSGELVGENAVSHILAQPSGESKRVIIVYTNGLIILWSIQESKPIFKTGGNAAKEVTAASWACPFGSKLVVGYKNGEILVWNIPTDKESSDSWVPQSSPICKLNLGYKLDNIAISKLKYSYGDGKASRLYVIGSSDIVSANLIQVVLLNEQIESRTIKLTLNIPEPCIDLEIVTSFSVQSKQKIDHLLLLGKSGNIYMYDDSLIERYLLQIQSNKSFPSLPKQVKTKLPFVDSNITVASLVTDTPCLSSSIVTDNNTMYAKDILPLFPFQTKLKDSDFSKAKNLYITGHENGAINFWDVTCPLLSPVALVTQQNEDDLSLTGVAITALYFSFDLRLLISGDQNGTVRVYKLKSEAFLPGGSKKGANHMIKSVKLVKVNGAVLCINPGNNLKHFAVGSDQGYVSLIDFEGLRILYEKHIKSEICNGVISVQFETCSFHGFEKNVLMVATKDSSVLALEIDTGNIINSNMICPNTPSKALFMQILEISGRGSSILDVLDMTKGNSDNVVQKQQGLLLCSERAVYVYSLSHVLQGIKKVFYKKKFQSSSLCGALTFKSPDSTGLILLFSSGKIEIRSLPELSLLKDISIRGLKANTGLDSSVCFSHNGDLILVSGDQEAFFVSVSLQKETYRFMESASRVYDKDLVVANGGFSTSIIPKEKKKGIFSSFIKDNPGAKANDKKNLEAEDTSESIEVLSNIFSVDNFPSYVNTVKIEEKSMKKDDSDLDIDDIDIDDHEEKPKGNSMMGALNKKKFKNTFQAMKGKWKHMKVSTDKTQADKTQANITAEEDKGGAIDEIKKKYGYASTSPNEQASFANTAKIKLGENLKKLQGISLKTTEMQESAQSFSNMAKEVLRIAENDKRSP